MEDKFLALQNADMEKMCVVTIWPKLLIADTVQCLVLNHDHALRLERYITSLLCMAKFTQIIGMIHKCYNNGVGKMNDDFII